MNRQLTTISANLTACRLGTRSPRGTALINEVYGGIFPGDFYRDIWDEPVLLALQEFITEHPPEHDVFGPQLEFIRDRTAQVISINDIFASWLFRGGEDLSHAATQPEVAQVLRTLRSSGALTRINESCSQPWETLSPFVNRLASEVPSMAQALNSCLSAVCERQQRGEANCLLVAQQPRVGVVLPVRTLLEPGTGAVRISVPAQDVFQSAVGRARGALLSLGLLGTDYDITFSAGITDAVYSGGSATLAAAMAIYSCAREWRFDPYTAFTGNIDIRDARWRIVRVESIPEKLHAAERAGIRRIVLPRENEPDVPESGKAFDLLFVDEINDVLGKLTLPRDTLPADTTQQRKVAVLNAYSSTQGWQVSAAREIQGGLQFTISPAAGQELTINIFNTGTHTPRDHQKVEFKGLLDDLGDLDSPSTQFQSVQQTFNIKDRTLRRKIEERLQLLEPSAAKGEQYCEYSFVYESGKERLAVNQYVSGKLLLQGYAGPLYRRVLEAIVPLYNLHYPKATLNAADYLSPNTPRTRSGHGDDVWQPTISPPYIGTDESGKGDYFGPLVIAGVWVDEALQDSLLQMGVRDSKELTDSRCRELADAIRRACPGKYHVVEISPDKYNELYHQFVREKRNLNHLLAWGHARAIESLLNRQQCEQAVADQFGDERYISSKLMEKGKALKLIQTPKAERFIAVAAASVLARDRFLSRLSHLSEEAGVRLPKGASSAVIEAARQIVQERGANALGKFAKLHFKTTTSVLGRVR
jgi:ribonuclease HIII